MEAQFSTDRKKKNIGYMISLVSAAVNGHQPVEPTDDINFGIVYKFLKLHTLANTAFYAVEKLEHKPETELFAPGHGGAHQADEALYLPNLRRGMVILFMALLEADKTV